MSDFITSSKFIDEVRKILGKNLVEDIKTKEVTEPITSEITVTEDMVSRAIGQGLKTFDVSDVYGNKVTVTITGRSYTITTSGTIV